MTPHYNPSDWPETYLEDCRRFFEEVHPNQPIGMNVYPDVFTSPLFPLQRMRELERMLETSRKVFPTVVMEIGTDKLGGLYHWCRGLQSVTHVISCEVRGCPHAEFMERAFPKIKFLWVPGDSRSPANQVLIEKWLRDKGLGLDVLFIDGDKGSYLQDFDAYKVMMNPAGLVFLHDIHPTLPPDGNAPCRRAFEEIKRRGYHTNEILNTTEWEHSRRRMEKSLRALNSYDGWLRDWKGTSCGVGVVYV